MSSINRKNLFVFVDFDGTLSPIVPNPDKAVLPNDTRGLLQAIAKRRDMRLAVISGRNIRDVKKRVGIKNAIYSGNHGLQLEGPRISFESYLTSHYRNAIAGIKQELRQRVVVFKGAFVEDKGSILSLHYRLVRKSDIPKLKTVFHETVIYYLVRNAIRIGEGKMVLEVRPPVAWDKGKIVLWLLARGLFSAGNRAVMPLYIGDDKTDEDAFRVLRDRGITIYVGRPRKSFARYYVKSYREVKDVLRKLMEDKQ